MAYDYSFLNPTIELAINQLLSKLQKFCGVCVMLFRTLFHTLLI